MDLVNQVQQDKKDGDVKVRIAPNAKEDEFEIRWKEELQEVRDHFGSDRFSLDDLIKVLNKSRPTVVKRTKEWKAKGVLFDSGDSRKGYTFDENSISNIPFDTDFKKAKQILQYELFTRSKLAITLGIEPSTAGQRLRDWQNAGVVYYLHSSNEYTFDSTKVSPPVKTEGTHESIYVDKNWNVKINFSIRETFYKKRFTTVRKAKVLANAILPGETNDNGEQLYECAFTGKTSKKGPKHKDKITESELEIDHDPNVTEHWEKDGRFQTQEERNNWYDDPKHLQVLCESCNSSKNQGVYNRKVGKDFRGPRESNEK